MVDEEEAISVPLGDITSITCRSHGRDKWRRSTLKKGQHCDSLTLFIMSPPAIRTPVELWNLIVKELIEDCPLAVLQLARTCAYIRAAILDERWKDIFRTWFKEDAEMAKGKWRAAVCANGGILADSVLEIAAMLISDYSFHPLVNYIEEDILQHLQRKLPVNSSTISRSLLIKATQRAAPYFSIQASEMGDSWPDKIFYRKKVRCRLLVRHDSTPAPLPDTGYSAIAGLYVMSVRGQYRTGFFEDLFLIHKVGMENLLRSYHETAPVVPFCLPCMKTLKSNDLSAVMQMDIGSFKATKNHPSGRAMQGQGLYDRPNNLRGPSHLWSLLQIRNVSNVLILFFHPSCDFLESILDWAPLATGLSDGSALGYAFTADMSILNGWDRNLFGRDSIDYIIAVRMKTIRLVAASTDSAGLDARFKEGILAPWLQSLGVDDDEVQRFLAVIARTENYRGKVTGPLSFLDGSPRTKLIIGDSVALRYKQDAALLEPL
ncbi:unnamed protein product [Mycena citricolor]|uniref:Uncharacterized protein n=1 Tax=Mycena citricolor TaxID=2018698 RepID=A0AAD2HDS1_9AGAR|nr:unnamed protein product [Mycena citricolor]